MTYKENITAILECYFTGFKKEIIDSACNRILQQEPTYYPPCIDCNKKMDEIRRAYDKLKEQEPKIGYWSRKTKVDAYDIAGVKTWGIKCQCDRCDFKTIVVEDFGYYKYCPNCGCRMVKPQESEEINADSN